MSLVTVKRQSEEYISVIAAEQRDIYNGIEKGNDVSKIENRLTETGFVKQKSYEDFIKLLLFESNMNLDYSIILSLDMSDESKIFWLEELSKFNNNGIELRNSSLFNTKYFNPNSKLLQNLYLERSKYNLLKQQKGVRDPRAPFYCTNAHIYIFILFHIIK